MLIKRRWALRALVVFAGLCSLAAGATSGAALAAPATPAAAVAAAPPPAEFFFRSDDIDAVRLSPSGRWLAMSVPMDSGRLGLVVIDLQTAQPLATVANYSNSDVGRFEWVNDEQLVYDLADLQTPGGEQKWWPGLIAVRRDGTARRVLVSEHGSAPDTRVISAYRPRSFDHDLQHVPVGGGSEVIVGQWIYGQDGEVDTVVPLRLDINTGRTRRVLSEAMGGVTDWIYSPEGEPRVAIKRSKTRSAVLWRGPGMTSWRTLFDAPRHQAPFHPIQIDAQGRLFITMENERGTEELRRYDFDKGTPATEAFVSTPGYDFSGYIINESNSARSLGVRLLLDAETTVWFDPRLKAVQAEAEKRLPGRVVRLACRRCEHPDMTVLVRAFSDRDPGQLWVHTVADGRWLKVGEVRRGTDPRRMASVDLQQVTTRDGRQMPVWITQPTQMPRPPGGWPTVVLVHGGPWLRGRAWDWEPMSQFLASRGYLVIEPEFRGSQGYGGEWFRAGWGQWGRAMQDDVADATRWAAAHAKADARRVCIAGASYGGYATLMGLVRHPELYRCGAAWVAVTDPRLMFQWRYESDQNDAIREVDYPLWIGDPAKDPALFDAISPVKQAARVRAPLLLAFGEKDRRVPMVHGNDMRRALQDAGRPHDWVVYEGEGHGWLLLRNQIDFANRLERFFGTHLAAP